MAALLALLAVAIAVGAVVVVFGDDFVADGRAHHRNSRSEFRLSAWFTRCFFAHRLSS